MLRLCSARRIVDKETLEGILLVISSRVERQSIFTLLTRCQVSLLVSFFGRPDRVPFSVELESMALDNFVNS